MKSAVSEIEKQLGPITILVNNAGIAVDKPALRQTEDDWNKVLATNLTGPWLVAQTVARGMAKRSSEAAKATSSSGTSSSASSNSSSTEGSSGSGQSRSKAVGEVGSIINISSVAGLGPSPYMPGYAASKAGLVRDFASFTVMCLVHTFHGLCAAVVVQETFMKLQAVLHNETGTHIV